MRQVEPLVGEGLGRSWEETGFGGLVASLSDVLGLSIWSVGEKCLQLQFQPGFERDGDGDRPAQM